MLGWPGCPPVLRSWHCLGALGFKTEGASVHALRPRELAVLHSRLQWIEVFPPSCDPRACFLSPRWSLPVSHLLGFHHAQQVPPPHRYFC